MQGIFFLQLKGLVFFLLTIHIYSPDCHSQRILQEAALTSSGRTGLSISKSTNNSLIGLVYLDYVPEAGLNGGSTLYYALFKSNGALQFSDRVLRSSDNAYAYNPYIKGISIHTFVACYVASNTKGLYASIWNSSAILKQNFKVSSGSGGVDGTCTIAVLSSGNFVIFWNTGNNIKFQIYDSTGTSIGPEISETFTVATSSGSSCDSFNNGDFFCTYVKIDSFSSSSGDIYGQKFDGAGNKIGSEILINEDTCENEHSPKVKIENNNIIVCYIVEGISVNFTNVKCKSYTNASNAAPNADGTSFLITDASPGDMFPPSNAVDFISNVIFLVTLHDESGNVKTYKMNTDGTQIGTALSVNTYTTGCYDTNAAYTSGDGNYFWVGDSGTSKDIYYLRYPAIPQCLNYNLSILPYQTLNLDFTSLISDPFQVPVKVSFSALPTVGIIQQISNNSLISINIPYELNQLKYTSVATSEMISFKGVNLSGSLSSSCSLNINIGSCWTTCDTCSYVGDSINNNCITCKAGDSHKLYEQPSQCITSPPDLYYLNLVQDMYKPCYLTCKTCSNDGTFETQNCLTCKTQYIPQPYDSTKCVTECNLLGGEKWYIDPSNNAYTCTNQCPSIKPYLYESTSECLANCEGLFVYNTLCVNTCPTGTMLYMTTCYEACPTYTFTDNLNFVCINCKASGKVYYKDKCISSPPTGTTLVNSELNAYEDCYLLCASCKEIGNSIDNKCDTCISSYYPTVDRPTQCLNTAPEYYYLSHFMKQYRPCYSSCLTCTADGSSSSHFCLSCRNSENYFFNGNCLSECPSYTIPTSAKICINCKDTNQYYFNGQCMDFTPSGTIKVSDTYNAYVTCKDNGMYVLDDQCVASCPDDYSVNFVSSICYLCKTIGSYSYKAVCYATCPDTFEIDEVNKKCINCKDKGLFFYNKKCILSCPSSYIPDSSNICQSCPVSFPYTYHGVCYTSCPANLISDQSAFKCINCKDSGDFKFNDRCISISCPDGYGSDYENICTPCKTEALTSYSFKGKCVENCPSNYFTDNETYSCINCDDVGVSTASGCIEYKENLDKLKTLGNIDNLNSTIKETIKDYIANLIALNATYSQTITANQISIQISNSSSSSITETTQEALDNHLSIVDFAACEKVLREYYNYSSTTPFFYAKVDYAIQNSNSTNGSSTPNVSASSISFDVYGPDYKKIDTKICSDQGIEIKVSIPLVVNNSVINFTSYENNSDIVDIYNSSSSFYNDRCHTYSTNSGDITLNDRRKEMYSGYDAVCSINCTYGGLNTSINYAKCICQDISGEMSISFIENLLDLFTTFNIDIAKCINRTFLMPQFSTNIGFLFFIGLAFFAAFTASLAVFLDERLFSEKGIESVYNNNGGILHEFSKSSEKQDSQELSPFAINVNPIPASPPRNELNQSQDGNSSSSNSNEVSSKDGNWQNISAFKIGNEESQLPKKISTNQISHIGDESPSIKQPTYLSFKMPTVSIKRVPTGRFPSVHKLFIKDENSSNAPHISENIEMVSIKNCFVIKENHMQCKNNKINISNISDETNIVQKAVSSQRSSVVTQNPMKIPTQKQDPKFTKNDIMNMSYQQAILYDKRGIIIQIWDHIMVVNYIFSTFFLDSLLVPKFLRIIFFFFAVSINFFSNALFYLDSYISDKTKHPSLNAEFGYTFINEFLKCTIAAFFSSTVKVIFVKIAEPKKEDERSLNKALKTKSIEKVRAAYNFFLFRMRIRHCTFIITILGFFFFFLYYVTTFCAVYNQSQWGWFYGGIISNILDICGFQFAWALIIAVNRYIAIKFKCRCLYDYNILVIILNFISL